jgi:hypothetical protein
MFFSQDICPGKNVFCSRNKKKEKKKKKEKEKRKKEKMSAPESPLKRQRVSEPQDADGGLPTLVDPVVSLFEASIGLLEERLDEWDLKKKTPLFAIEKPCEDELEAVLVPSKDALSDFLKKTPCVIETAIVDDLGTPMHFKTLDIEGLRCVAGELTKYGRAITARRSGDERVRMLRACSELANDMIGKVDAAVEFIDQCSSENLGSVFRHVKFAQESLRPRGRVIVVPPNDVASMPVLGDYSGYRCVPAKHHNQFNYGYEFIPSDSNPRAMTYVVRFSCLQSNMMAQVNRTYGFNSIIFKTTGGTPSIYSATKSAHDALNEMGDYTLKHEILVLIFRGGNSISFAYH